ncbi:uncharacterized protein LOC111705474 [Eurytemora carolleeae]|uniref:uncharacterized protein LOC111705474 n=1 Tax=Eurytemora carolleeae TaxID=1294199 RepID=UPI000C793838|nr:uncharacterized protein LOC111705474 [Eurytemora carolleeae]|eukprot:XP_023333801.1 uncharacterized protein LOC111705474 [Eurytemora affinis]
MDFRISEIDLVLRIHPQIFLHFCHILLNTNNLSSYLQFLSLGLNVVYLVSCSLHNILYPEHCCIQTQLFQPSYHPSQDCTDGETIEMDVIADLEKTSTEVQSSQGPKNQDLESSHPLVCRLESQDVFHKSEENLERRENPNLLLVLVLVLVLLLNSGFRVGSLALLLILLRFWSLIYLILLLLVLFILSRTSNQPLCILLTTVPYRFCTLRNQSSSLDQALSSIWRMSLNSWVWFGVPCLLLYVLVAGNPYLLPHWQELNLIKDINYFISFDLSILCFGLLSLPFSYLLNQKILRRTSD